jgi:hypothetical protein
LSSDLWAPACPLVKFWTCKYSMQMRGCHGNKEEILRDLYSKLSSGKIIFKFFYSCFVNITPNCDLLVWLTLFIFELSPQCKTNMLRSACMSVVPSDFVVKANSNTNTSSNISSLNNTHLQCAQFASDMPLLRGPACFNSWTTT